MAQSLFKPHDFDDLPEEHRSFAASLANNKLDNWLKSWNFTTGLPTLSLKMIRIMRGMIRQLTEDNSTLRMEVASMEQYARKIENERDMEK